MIRHPRYVIAVHDLEAVGTRLPGGLGFEVREIGDPGWRFFLRDQCFIVAGECPEALSPRELGDHSYFAYREVDEIDQLSEARCDVTAGSRGSEDGLDRPPFASRKLGRSVRPCRSQDLLKPIAPFSSKNSQSPGRNGRRPEGMR